MHQQQLHSLWLYNVTTSTTHACKWMTFTWTFAYIYGVNNMVAGELRVSSLISLMNCTYTAAVTVNMHCNLHVHEHTTLLSFFYFFVHKSFRESCFLDWYSWKYDKNIVCEQHCEHRTCESSLQTKAWTQHSKGKLYRVNDGPFSNPSAMLAPDGFICTRPPRLHFDTTQSEQKEWCIYSPTFASRR